MEYCCALEEKQKDIPFASEMFEWAVVSESHSGIKMTTSTPVSVSHRALKED